MFLSGKTLTDNLEKVYKNFGRINVLYNCKIMGAIIYAECLSTQSAVSRAVKTAL